MHEQPITRFPITHCPSVPTPLEADLQQVSSLMPHPISEKVLQEILRAFAWEEASLPSDDALRELAAATGHREGGGEGDPWEALSNHVPE
jgi:hypothetical protein